MAKLLAQTSNGIVEFLATSKTNEANTEKRPPKRSAQNPVNSEGQMLSNSRHLTNGGPSQGRKVKKTTK